MLYGRRVVCHAGLLADGHGIGGVHPAHHEVGRKVAVAIGITGEGDVTGACLLQLRQREFDVFRRAHLVGDALYVARVLGSGCGEAVIGTFLHHVALQCDAAAEIHVEMLCRQSLSPLHEQPDGIAFHVETRALKCAGSVLYSGGAVAHTHRNIVQTLVDIDGLGIGFLLGEPLAHCFGIQLFNSFDHVCQLFFAIKREQRVGVDGDAASSDGSCQPGTARVEIQFGVVAQTEDEPRRKSVKNTFERLQGVVLPETQHGGKQAACKQSGTFAKHTERLGLVVRTSRLIESSRPSLIFLLIEHIKDLGKMLKTVSARVFAKAQGMDHPHPHAPFGIHVLSSLLSGHRHRIEPCGSHAAVQTVVLEFQLLALLRRGKLAFIVGKPIFVGVGLPLQLNQVLRFDDLHQPRLLIPEKPQYVQRRL